MVMKEKVDISKKNNLFLFTPGRNRQTSNRCGFSINSVLVQLKITVKKVDR